MQQLSIHTVRVLTAILWISSCADGLAERFDYHAVRGRASTAAPNTRLEGEIHFSRGEIARVQSMSHFGPHWSGDSHLLWSGKIDSTFRTRFEVQHNGQYRVVIQCTSAPDYGRFDIALDGAIVFKDVDLFANKVQLSEPIELEEINFTTGSHVLEFKLTGANPQAVPFRGDKQLLGLDYLKLERTDGSDKASLQPTANEQPKGSDNIQETEKAPTSVVAPVSLSKANSILGEFCVSCHSGDSPEANIDLSVLSTRAAYMQDIDTAQKVARAIAYHTMPPKDEKQPTKRQREELTSFFDRLINEFVTSTGQSKPIVMRRLNRFEYNNAVRDLLELKGDIYPLPEKAIRADRPYFDPKSGHFPDAIQLGNRTLGKNQVEKQILTGISPFAIDLQSEHGFNNRGEELSISPLLLESFLKLGHSIVFSPEFDDYCHAYNSLFQAGQDLAAEEKKALAKQRLRPLLRRAFRAPVSNTTLDRYARYFDRQLDTTASFPRSMKQVVAAILASPRFLFLTEMRETELSSQRLSPFELATRLSFFLWSTIPDRELLDAAQNGQLNDESGIRRQVTRMLEDPRSQSLSINFARQWLRLDQLITAVPDFERFETYYARIGCEQWKFGLQTMLEPLLLFESILVEDRSIMLLIDSNYAYRSDELQSWYNDEVPFGKRNNRNRFNTNQQVFRRRQLNSRRQGGVITSAATMTMTSSPLRTKPITRGAWVATVVFNDPPPPPPDIIPEIEADDAAIEAKGLTLRDRLVQHQVNQSCVACHERIDPLGFALENFDAVGRWRDEYASGLQIDSTGQLFGHVKFSNIAEFKNAILENPSWFMRAFCEHMLSYALGRELTVHDKPSVDKIVRQVMHKRGQFSTVIAEVATSSPFLYKHYEVSQTDSGTKK